MEIKNKKYWPRIDCRSSTQFSAFWVYEWALSLLNIPQDLDPSLRHNSFEADRSIDCLHSSHSIQTPKFPVGNVHAIIIDQCNQTAR